MSNRVIIGQESSVDSKTNTHVDARNVDWRPTCPECEGRVISENVEAVCGECGLVVSIDALQRAPTMCGHAPTNTERDGEWAVETINELRTDKGLHTTFFLRTDGKGNPLSTKKFEQMRRLKMRHKRFTMTSDRDKRMNEGFRDIGMLGANLELPEFVTTQSSRYLEAAKEHRLPGGRMAWESLAAGAVLLAGRETGVERTPGEIAAYAKTSRERVCAAARKIRVQTDVDVPPVRDRAVEAVVKELSAAGVGLETGLELARVGERLMNIADAEPIGPGTARLTVAGAAVYVADRMTNGKAVTQREVVDAVEATIPSSKWKVKHYAQELYDVSGGRLRTRRAKTGPVSAD
jgi:transcription initiation factor TFIIB